MSTVDDRLASLPDRYLQAPRRYSISPQHQAAADRARRFLVEELIPLEPQVPECDPLPPELEQSLPERARAYDLWAVATPKEYGGQGLGELGYVLVREQIAQSVLGDIRHDRGVGGDPWPTLFLASEDQKRKYLEPVLSGEHGMFFGLTEPGGGSDAAGIRTAATKVGDGWVINGAKKWIGRGGERPFGIVFAVTDPDRRAKGGITAFFVDRGTPGFTHVRDVMTMGAARTAELRFEDCWVPDENVLGEVGRAFEYAQQALSRTRVRQAVLNLAAAQRAFDLLMRWMPERRTFGRVLADRQPLRWRVARAAADLQSARHMIYRAAWQIDEGDDPRWEVPTMKTHAAQMASRVIDLSMQFHGALGVSKEMPLERLYRDIRGFRISEGADEVQRMLVARELVGRER